MTRLSKLMYATLAILLVASCQPSPPQLVELPPFLSIPPAEADAALAQMSTDEKIGQLIIVRADASADGMADQMAQHLKAHRMGGIWTQGGPLNDYVALHQRLAQQAAVPLFWATAEGGLFHQQFSDLSEAPSSSARPYLPNDSLATALDKWHLEQAYALGFNLSFSFRVASLRDGTPLEPGTADRLLNYQGLEILGMAKADFSPLLRTASDTSALKPLLIPFRALVEAGVSGFLLEADNFRDTYPASDYLRTFMAQHLDFQGLLAAEASDDRFWERQLRAGVHLFVVDNDPAPLHQFLRDALQRGQLSPKSLDDRVRKILRAKLWMRTDEPIDRFGMAPSGQAAPSWVQRSVRWLRRQAPALDTVDLPVHFCDPAWEEIRDLSYRKSLCVVSNSHAMLPLATSSKARYHLTHAGPAPMPQFERSFQQYADIASSQHRPLPQAPGIPLLDRDSQAVYVVTLHDVALSAQRDTAWLAALYRLADARQVVLVHFGDLAGLRLLDPRFTLLHLPHYSPQTAQIAAEALFGASDWQGTLPLSAGEIWPSGTGELARADRLRRTRPEEAGIASRKLVKIDSIVADAIRKKVFPGCQIAVASQGKLVYSRSFGHQTYDKKAAPVRPTDLYDVASLTKIAATTLAAMHYFDTGELNGDAPLDSLLDLEADADIRLLNLQQVLTHQTGLQANLPIAPYILVAANIRPNCRGFFCNRPTSKYTVTVASKFFFSQAARQALLSNIYELKPTKRRDYRYSDANFVLLQKVLERHSGQPLNILAETLFYKPLGLERTCFKPRERFPLRHIVPTEKDDKWRKQLVHGYVHDEAAGLLGGVAGHAGLFSNAEDLAVLFQMMLNNGTYGGRRYLSQETIAQFTSADYGNHRGLGFDKPRPKNELRVPKAASASTFGHTGFTGTCLWADPEEELLYVFLSNRINPSKSNTRIFQEKTRERIHKALYDALRTHRPRWPVLDVLPDGLRWV